MSKAPNSRFEYAAQLLREAASFLPQQDAALRQQRGPDEIILQEGDKIKLLRLFWGHKAGTKGRVYCLFKTLTPVNGYVGRLRFRGSDPVMFRPEDVNTLFIKI
jgi:hypothetical protein